MLNSNKFESKTTNLKFKRNTMHIAVAYWVYYNSKVRYIKIII